MSYAIKPFTEEHISAAVALFAQNYNTARTALPLLPARAIEDKTWIANELSARLKSETGAICLREDKLAGYMLTCHRFPFKGQRTVLCSEYAHSAQQHNREDIYRQLYAALSAEWVADGAQLHIIGHLATDSTVKETLYQLGFGAILAERLRATEPLDVRIDAEITCEKNGDSLIDLHAEHMGYYSRAPIFVRKDSSRANAQKELAEYGAEDEFLIYRDEAGIACAYFIVGESGNEEGFLLQKTHTAQIKNAYVQAHLRGQGIGRALLDQAIRWAKDRGFARVFVEHETANRHGSHFWSRHFAPYLYISARYVDKSL